jgi:hypothetical protein
LIEPKHFKKSNDASTFSPGLNSFAVLTGRSVSNASQKMARIIGSGHWLTLQRLNEPSPVRFGRSLCGQKLIWVFAEIAKARRSNAGRWLSVHRVEVFIHGVTRAIVSFRIGDASTHHSTEKNGTVCQFVSVAVRPCRKRIRVKSAESYFYAGIALLELI